MNNRTTLVTGTGGFVGGRLVEAIYLSEFGRVRAGIRRWANASRVARFPVDFVPCDITKPAEVRAASEGADAVVHCAYAGTRELIVDGTRNMLQAALEAGVRRFVYLSSAEVYGPDVAGMVDETQSCTPTGRVYGDAKLEAEALVQEFGQRGLATTILRPSIIYGPFSQSWTIDLATRLQSGNWGRFEGHGDGICNLVYVDDLIRAVFLAIESEAAAGEIFNVVGPDRLTWNEYFERFNGALELPPLRTIARGRSTRVSAIRDRANAATSFLKRHFEGPLMRIYLGDSGASRLMKRVKNKLKTTASGSELKNLYSREAQFSIEKAMSLLGYRPRVDLDSGLAVCRQWLAFHGYLEQSLGAFAPDQA